MGKRMSFASQFEGEAPEEMEGAGFYEGSVPPKGIYVTKLKFLKLKENRHGQPMLNGILEINEPEGSEKSKYNGYGIWFNQNVTRQGAGYLNKFLDALCPKSVDRTKFRKMFYNQLIVDNSEDPPVVEKIGTVRIDGKDHRVVVDTKRGSYQGDDKLEVRNYLLAKLDEDVEDETDIDEDEEVIVEDEDETDEVDDVEDDDENNDSDDDDNEEDVF